MISHRADSPAPAVVTVTGLGLALAAVLHHATELATIGDPTGPLAALILDGVPAVGLAYAGYWLADREFGASQEWHVTHWCLAGFVLFVCTMALSIAIRLAEGRIVSEPVFTLLLVAEAGALAGFVAGYYRSRALVDKRRAEQSAEGLAVVNDVIRHDLRNDLLVIEGTADLLALDHDGELADRAATICDRAKAARDRLDDTEAVAKTMSGTASLGTVDLVAVVKDIVAHIETTTGVAVETALPETARVTANDGLASVVDNLVENAVEHGSTSPQSHTPGDAAEHAGSDPTVAVSVERAADTVTLTVRDDGPGLPAEHAAFLEGDRDDGPGGGLRIVRRLVSEYDGVISVTDADPQGTVVSVELPGADR